MSPTSYRHEPGHDPGDRAHGKQHLEREGQSDIERNQAPRKPGDPHGVGEHGEVVGHQSLIVPSSLCGALGLLLLGFGLSYLPR